MKEESRKQLLNDKNLVNFVLILTWKEIESNVWTIETIVWNLVNFFVFNFNSERNRKQLLNDSLNFRLKFHQFRFNFNFHFAFNLLDFAFKLLSSVLNCTKFATRTIANDETFFDFTHGRGVRFFARLKRHKLLVKVKSRIFQVTAVKTFQRRFIVNSVEENFDRYRQTFIELPLSDSSFESCSKADSVYNAIVKNSMIQRSFLSYVHRNVLSITYVHISTIISSYL